LDDFQAICFKQAFERGRLAQLTTLLLDGNRIGAVGAQALGDGIRHCELLRELSVAQNPIGIGLVHLCKAIRDALVVLNVSQADISDVGAVAAGQALSSWSKMSALRMSGNKEISLQAAEVVARGVLASPSLKLADLSGSSAQTYSARVARIFTDAQNNPSRMRV
jgi:Ran GTPase-activating protein (RanGAP) involved in mRNA processing and transport